MLAAVVFLLVTLGIVSKGWPQFVTWPLMFVVLTTYSLYRHITDFPIIALWLIVGALACFWFVGRFRKRWLTKPLLKSIEKGFPAMSQTEREALEAGDVWWDAELMSGDPDWQTLLNYKTARLSTEELSFIDNQVNVLCGMVNDWEIIEGDDLPANVWQYLKQEKFFGMIIPKANGGLGFSAYAHSTVVMKLASCSVTLAITVMVPNSLGPAELLLKYGTESQKGYYLPRLAEGLDIPCFALTSEEAGSDASSMTDYGVVCEGRHEGRSVLGIRLNFNKRYITMAPVATVVALAFKLYDPDRLLGEEALLGITVCLLPTTTQGVHVGDRHYPMHMPFMNGPVEGKDVFVPLEWVIGGPEQIGQGWRMLMECLSEGRGISLPAVSTAACKHAYRVSGAYARIRRQFKIPISQFDGVEQVLAGIAGQTYMVEAMRQFLASAVTSGCHPSIASAIGKYHMTEMARDAINAAMDIHGGSAIQTGPNNYLFPAYLSLPIGITVEGANILTRNLIIFGQGVVRCHPYLLQELQIITSEHPDKLNRFDEVLKRHIGFTLATISRAFLSGLTAGFATWGRTPKPIRKYTRQLTRMSTALALLSDVSLLVLGGRLKRRECLSARLGDVLSYSLMASSCLKYYKDNEFSQTDSASVHWVMRHCLYQSQEAITQFLNNFPVKSLARALQFIIFPWGRPFKAPSDQLNHQVVKPMLEFTALRERLVHHTYLKKSADNPLGRVECALEKALTLTGLEKRFMRMRDKGEISPFGEVGALLQQAFEKSLLTEDEVYQLQEYYQLKSQVLAVDTFDANLEKL